LAAKGTLLDILLVIGLLVICFVFLKRNSLTRYTSGKSQPKTGTFHASQSDNAPNDETTERGSRKSFKLVGKEIGDLRPQECHTQDYKINELATVIIAFNDYQFYNLKTTIESVVSFETDHIQEIIIVDDGSTLKYIIEECDAFIKTIPKARLLRHENQIGQLKSRVAAMGVAKSDIVVFLDVSVVCSRGWLDPLIVMLIKYPRYIAVPHYDSLRDPVAMEYTSTSRNLLATWTWNFVIKMRRIEDYRIHDRTQYIVSPALRGNAFAVRRSFLKTIGSLDESFEDGGGEYMDLSLKTCCVMVGFLSRRAPGLECSTSTLPLRYSHARTCGTSLTRTSRGKSTVL